MPTNGYQVALEHATHEINEINALIEKLARRRSLVEKLVELLKDVDSPSEPADSSARVADAPARETLLEYAEFEAEPAMEMSEGNSHSLTYDQVAELAHRYWSERGQSHGQHEQDWLRAEQELRGTAA